MPNNVKQQKTIKVHVGPQGRIVIPAQFRESLDISTGETLIARVEDGRLVLETRERILARIRSWFADVPPEVSLVDELIAERREEARREAEE
ncbi:MAG: AbrB family transcriptional regulator [SAR202 cluster bacterium Io17-Chloro-G4]|nr:MAG: AbrB family transcriptional regulator [SAR202 cluster bacterium Io17-Chloro-G4]